MSIGVAQAAQDETLVEFCREVVTELFGADWALVAGVPGYMATLEDLAIWDFTPRETAIPQGLEPAKLRKHWFVVHRKDLPALRAVVGTADLNALLKPLSPGALGAILGGANPKCNERNADSAWLGDSPRVQRDEMLQLLIQANLKLQEIDQQRNNFLARSVHDFRAPLTAISGYCALLLEEEFGPLTPEQAGVLGGMLQSATRLSRSSIGMFQLSVPHNIDQRGTVEQADIRDCLDRALEEVALMLEDKRISIMTEIDPAPDGLLFDKSQIQQTLVNLVGNACKFTPRDGSIAIRGYRFFWERRSGPTPPLAGARERRVGHGKVFNSFRVDIRDSGPGIPAVHVGRIFEEYTSCRDGQDRSGEGLGLAICRMILERHLGRIWAESIPSGAVFSFVLPLQRTVARPYDVENSSEAACLTETVES